MTDANAQSSYVFISYSSRDSAFVHGLREKLRDNNIEYWVDREGIPPGASNWEHAIRKAIHGAGNVILVVSPYSFESNVVQGEIALAEMQKLTIYPVWAHGDHFLECVPLKMGKAQYIDMRSDRYETGLQQLLEAIQQHKVERAYTPPTVQPLPEGKDPRNPYKGLDAFREDDAKDFFGRDRLVGDLIKIVDDKLAESQRLLAVIGPSGSGKSSVVMAGLIPRLKAGAIPGSDDWIYLEPFTPSGDPLEELTFALRTANPPNFKKTIRQELEASNGRGLIKVAQDLVKTDGQHIVVYIDQFEELFTLVDDEGQREQFINTIVAAATLPESPVIVLLTLRADFYDRPMNYNLLGDLIQHNNRSVLPLTLGELNDAITLPAQLDDVQLEFERDLVAEIAFDLLEFRAPADKTTSLAGALPLLQFALSRLFTLRDGNKLTLEAYNEMGRVSGAIGSHAEEEFKKLSRIDDDVLDRVFYHLVTVNEQGTPTRRRSKRSDITQGNTSAERLVEALIRNRLLVAGKEEMLEVAHEALLRSWERLDTWIKNNARHLQWLQKVQAAAADWVRQDKPVRLLWNYEELQPVYEAIDHLRIDLSPTVREFTRPQMDRLLEDFVSEPEYRQMGIIDRWREIGPDAAPALVKALASAKDDTVVAAIDSALWMMPTEASQALIDGVESSNKELREASSHAVGRLGVVGAIDSLVANVASGKKRSCLAEIEALAALYIPARDNRDAVTALTAILDPEQNRALDERREAAHTLGLLLEGRGGKAVDVLIKTLLKDKRWEVREAAATALGRIRATDAVKPLISKARGEGTNGERESYHVSRAAVLSLGQIRQPQARTTLINAAVDDRDEVRKAAITALTDFDPANALSMLMYRLKDDVPGVRQATAEALGRFTHSHAVRPLMDALQSEDYPQARVAIVNALRTYDTRKDVVPVLRKTLKNIDNSPSVRAAAARALSAMHEQRSTNIRALLAVLKERKLPADVRASVVWSLGELRTKDATEPLFKELTRNRRWRTRYETAVALRKIGDDSLVTELKQLLEGKDSDAAFAAAVVLSGLGDNGVRVKNELLSALDDPRPDVRCIAAESLSELRAPDTLDRLLKELHNQQPAVREAVADAIHAFVDEPTRTKLIAMRDHPLYGVRRAAERALNGRGAL